MDYEKKYNEALERARALWREAIEKEYVEDYLKDYETIFPELRESEDERIRRTLVEYFGPKVQLDFVRGVPIQKIRDWLEKQKGDKDELVYRLNGLMQDYIKEGKDDEEKEHRLKCYQLFWDALEDANFFEQKEQKPLTPEEKVKHPLYIEGFEAGKEVGAQCEKVFKEQNPAEWDELQSEFKNINEAFEDGKKEVVAHPKKYGLCKPAEWSEEDENALKYIHELISWGYAEKFMDAQTAHDMRKWVNEHISHGTFQNGNSQWKPSAEQLNALNFAITYFMHETNYKNPTELRDLYDELLKLK